MRRIAMLLVLGSSLLAGAALAHDGESVHDVAGRLFRAVLAGDAVAASADILTYDDMKAMVKKPPMERDEYQKAVKDWLSDTAAVKTAGKTVGYDHFQVEDVIILPAGDKLRVEAVVATGKVYFLVDGKMSPGGTPAIFIKIGSIWKLSIHQ